MFLWQKLVSMLESATEFIVVRNANFLGSHNSKEKFLWGMGVTIKLDIRDNNIVSPDGEGLFNNWTELLCRVFLMLITRLLL